MTSRTKQDPDIKDREGTQPAKYHKDLAPSTKEKRDAHFKKGAKMDDDNPAAYKPAPGDKKAKTKPSKYTKKFKRMYGEETIEESSDKALKNKAEKSGVSVSILRKVYNRGVAAWRTGHRPGTTPEQWGLARVNSFLTGGKTRTTADADLWKKAKSQKESVELDEAKYKVDIEGLPHFYMDADSPAQVKIELRKLLKRSSLIQDVDRVNDAKIRQDYRDRAAGKTTEKEIEEMKSFSQYIAEAFDKPYPYKMVKRNESLDEGLVDWVSRKMGKSWGKVGDRVRGSTVAAYLRSNTYFSDQVLKELARYNYQLKTISLADAQKYREFSDANASDDIMDPMKLDRARGRNITLNSLIKNPPVLDADGYIWDGNHRMARAIELGMKRIPVLMQVSKAPVTEALNKKQEVNGQAFEFDYHKKPTPSQQRVLKDVMIPYVRMYTKDGYDVVLRSTKDIGIDSRFTLFRKKEGGSSEVMADKLISKNGKVRDA